MESVSARKLPKSSDFTEDQVTPTVLMLLEFCHDQQEQIQALRDEIARLKGQKPKPNIKPSKLENGQKEEEKKNGNGKCGRQRKRKKTRALEIHEVLCIAPENVPKGSRFKGYEEFTVQDIRVEAHNIRYRMERWESPDGERALVRPQLPEIPLHNNLSEGDIREYVKKRKISSSTRSDEGRRSRDTFASLKETCRKNGLSFWQFLLDRISGVNRIPPLARLLLNRASVPFLPASP
jgi:hypothetical protein